MDHRHWQDWLIGAIGVGLIAVALWPGLAGAEGGGTWLVRANYVVAGLVVLLLAVAALTAFQTWEPGLAAAVGLWVAASPWLLGFADARALMTVAVVAGGAVFVLGIWSMVSDDTGEMG